MTKGFSNNSLLTALFIAETKIFCSSVIISIISTFDYNFSQLEYSIKFFALLFHSNCTLPLVSLFLFTLPQKAKTGIKN